MHAGTLADPKVGTYQQYVVMRAEFVAKVCIATFEEAERHTN